jgi:hypothetical protein
MVSYAKCSCFFYPLIFYAYVGKPDDTPKKKEDNFPHLERNTEGIGCKVIYEEGLLKVLGKMRKYLVIY